MSETSQFWKRWCVLFGIGALGVLSVAPITSELLREKLATLPSAPPLPVVLAASLAQSLVLLAIAVALGVRLAPQLGLRSHLAEWAATRAPLGAALRREWWPSALAGVLAFVVTALLDLLFRAFLPEPIWKQLQEGLTHTDFRVVLAGFFYGGIAEELFMRWGLMTLLAWMIWRVTRHQSTSIVLALVLSALAFGAGHLGATSLLVPLTPPVVAWALVLNGVVGLICGWLFWKRSLEAAMIAHAAWHFAASAVAQL